jgi:hypothetical protein
MTAVWSGFSREPCSRIAFRAECIRNERCKTMPG